jgi:hypothetical protein
MGLLNYAQTSLQITINQYSVPILPNNPSTPQDNSVQSFYRNEIIIGGQPEAKAITPGLLVVCGSLSGLSINTAYRIYNLKRIIESYMSDTVLTVFFFDYITTQAVKCTFIELSEHNSFDWILQAQHNLDFGFVVQDTESANSGITGLVPFPTPNSVPPMEAFSFDYYPITHIKGY